MTRVRITRNTVAARRPVMVGEVLDLPEPEASLLVAMRKAVEISIIKAEAIPPADPAAQGPVQTGDPPRASPGLTTETAGGIVKKVRQKLKKKHER